MKLNNHKKILSAALCAAMLATGMPGAVFAQEENGEPIFTWEESFDSTDIDLESAPASKFEISEHENDVVPLRGTFDEKLDQIREEFPEGRYWNHKSPDTSYFMSNTTDQPCDNHVELDGNYRCNVFDRGAQCAGFAYLCFYKMHGQKRSSTEYAKHVDGNTGIRAGDVIRIQGHTAFVWKVEGDNLSVFEVNYGGRCRINMSRAIDREKVLEYWTPIQYKVSYDSNGGSGRKESEFVREDAEHFTGANPFSNPGHEFIGWQVRRTSTGELLYVSPNKKYAYYPEGKQPKNWTPARLGEAVDLQKYARSGDEIELSAQWKNVMIYSVAFDANGGEGNMTPISIAIGELKTLPLCTFVREGMAFNYWYAKNDQDQWICSPTGYLNRNQIKAYDTLDAARKDGYVPVRISDEAPIRDLSMDAGRTVTLLAQWKPVEEMPGYRAMYRLYNPNSGEHFYTSDARERAYLVSLGWKYEKDEWFAPEKSGTPVYRLYNPNAGDHHYTLEKNERDYLEKQGWKYEGIGWYSDDAKGVPVYRQYNPNAKGAGAHNYSTDKNENDYLARNGWKAEGIGWYGIKR